MSKRDVCLDLLLALQLAALGPSINVFLLGHADGSAAERLLWLHRLVSRYIGSAYGWSEHTELNNPVGLWIQFTIVALLLWPFFFVSLRSLKKRSSGKKLLSWLPGVTALVVPWTGVFLTWSENSLNASTEGNVYLLVIGSMVATLSVAGVMRWHREPGKRTQRDAILGVLSSLALLLTLATFLHGYVRPVQYSTIVTSIILMATWVKSREATHTARLYGRNGS